MRRLIIATISIVVLLTACYLIYFRLYIFHDAQPADDIPLAVESARDVIFKYNQALPSLEARKFLTGDMLNQLDYIIENKLDLEKILLSNKMIIHNNRNIMVEQVSEDYFLVIIHDFDYYDGHKHAWTVENPLYFEVVKVNNKWKIRQRLSGKDDLEKSRKKSASDYR